MKPIKKENDGRVSVVATPNDTRLNLLLLFEKKNNKYRDDTMRILNRLKGFRYQPAGHFRRHDKLYMGMHLNMRELARALEIGAAQTIRVKDAEVQTDIGNLPSDHVNNDTSRNNASPDIFDSADATQAAEGLAGTFFESEDNFVPNSPDC